MGEEWQFDAECGPFARLRFFDKDASAVILLDDALGEGQTESPSTFFGRVSGVEYCLEVLA